MAIIVVLAHGDGHADGSCTSDGSMGIATFAMSIGVGLTVAVVVAPVVVGTVVMAPIVAVRLWSVVAELRCGVKCIAVVGVRWWHWHPNEVL